MTNNENPIILQKKYAFNELISWDHQINAWVKHFKKHHGYFPNILIASSGTYTRIDMVANARGKDRIANSKGEKTEAFVALSGFAGSGYSLEFCIMENLALDTLQLIYDSDPDGGLPIPEDDGELIQAC